MSTLLIAFRLLWKRKAANLVILLEVMLSVISLAQSFVFVMDYQDSMKGVSELPMDQTYVLYRFDYYSEQEVMQQLDKDPLITGIGRVRWNMASFGLTNCGLTVYNQSLIDHYKPSLKSGRWLDSDSPQEDDIMQAVVSGNLKLEVGDVIVMDLNGESLEIRVIGILAEPTQYLYPTGAASPGYFSADMIISDKTTVIIREEDLAAKNIGSISELTYVMPDLFIFTREGVSESDMQEALHKWNQYGEIGSMESITSKFFSKSKDQISAGVVSFITWLCLTLTVVLVNNVIQSMRNERRFTIYYLCGMKWKKGAAIEATRIGLLILILLPLAVLAGNLGWLMIFWMETRATLFYGLVSVYIILLFAAVSVGFLVKLTRTDVAAKLKDIRQGE